MLWRHARWDSFRCLFWPKATKSDFFFVYRSGKFRRDVWHPKKTFVAYTCRNGLWKYAPKTKNYLPKSRSFWPEFWRIKNMQKIIFNPFFFSSNVFGSKFQISQPGWYSDWAIKNYHMADFFRVVRWLVNFSLVTKRTKHVSKVREVIRRCEKIREDGILTLLMTSHTQKVTSWFLDSNFWAKLQISWPGWSADRSIKILHMENVFVFHGGIFDVFESTYAWIAWTHPKIVFRGDFWSFFGHA